MQVSREELVEAGLSQNEANIRLVRQSQDEVFRMHFLRLVVCASVLCILVFLVGVGLQVIFFIRYIQSSDQECDEPIRLWAEITLSIWVVRGLRSFIDKAVCCWSPTPHSQERSPWRVIIKDLAVVALDFGWVVCTGLHFLRMDRRESSTACSRVQPDLFGISKVYVSFHLASLVYLCLYFGGLRAVLRLMLRRGMLTTSSAAPKGALEANTIVVKLTDADLADNPSCPICIDDYVKNGETVVKTKTCGHLYHKQCLKNWMKTARTCPICREDLGLLGGQVSKE